MYRDQGFAQFPCKESWTCHQVFSCYVFLENDRDKHTTNISDMIVMSLFSLSLFKVNLFIAEPNTHNYSTRGSPFNFIVPHSKTHSSFTFCNTAIHHWNSLPNNIKATSNSNTFKQLVRKHLASHSHIWLFIVSISHCTFCFLPYFPSVSIFMLRTPMEISYIFLWLSWAILGTLVP